MSNYDPICLPFGIIEYCLHGLTSALDIIQRSTLFFTASEGLSTGRERRSPWIPV